MTKVSFYIRNIDTKKETPINFRINLSRNEKLRGTTKIKIYPQFWDKEKQKVRNRVEVSNIKDIINNRLREFESFILNKVLLSDTENPIEIKQNLKNDITEFFGRKTKKVVDTFYSQAEQFIEDTQRRTINEKPISKSTILLYKRTIKTLKEFEGCNQYPISFESITMDFYYNFIAFLKDKNFSPNTIGNYIKVLKVFLNDATEKGINRNLTYNNKNFIKPTGESFQIYLNEEELSSMINLDLSNDKKLDNARDLFIIGAYTGLRVSDFKNLSKDNIEVRNGYQLLNLIVSKTNRPISIPIHPKVADIITKNSGNFPKKMSDQHINKSLKEIGKLADINTKISYNTNKGGNAIKETKYKYEMITNHTGRRSFCTNAYINNMPTIDIMAISGHTTEKVFLTYIKIGAKERALKIADNNFFKK
ncbi:site-specific integrase [Tenacibaculum finnmarkense]|uniref:tyrosine-type recombinase/integrase n=1 Tax=Tenacibaculum finnmarkense TaxID=2781243 RepID=UPI001EFC2795|nr:site-specific integrase [Tenacibaculum finnmarkense]MCG8251099.1 site-specific integrase [Tenacibaculum finnmarkense genomovar finnmarkense]MCG8748419.1 site-specific integrase [Tenacibaculum finnmarkense]MCG8814210.1 site-specific integrase [Tenacibaculum finnmarkense]MCG8819235.1 site-specific integrase [Tenacibaculum finnmarkense]MCG8881987.1 site-specific integrase [Tenacibaculum finnmarkense]